MEPTFQGIWGAVGGRLCAILSGFNPQADFSGWVERNAGNCAKMRVLWLWALVLFARDAGTEFIPEYYLEIASRMLYSHEAAEAKLEELSQPYAFGKFPEHACDRLSWPTGIKPEVEVGGLGSHGRIL